MEPTAQEQQNNPWQEGFSSSAASSSTFIYKEEERDQPSPAKPSPARAATGGAPTDPSPASPRLLLGGFGGLVPAPRVPTLPLGGKCHPGWVACTGWGTSPRDTSAPWPLFLPPSPLSLLPPDISPSTLGV